MATASSSGWSSDLAGGADTVAAVATPPGRGALAVVRVSGARAHEVVRRVCPGLTLQRDWRAQLVPVVDRGEVLDEAVIITYTAPRSYTGEDMVELMVHASPFLLRRVVDGLVAAGARVAGPGEFTRRAVANGKLGLVEAEAVAALIEADSRSAFRAAREQLTGGLSERYRTLRESLVGLLAQLEATVDFGDSDGVGPSTAALEAALEASRRMLAGLASAAERGRVVSDGVRVVLAGPVNAGKSTLFNRLLGRDRAIVTPHPGTTRDLLEGVLEIEGVRVVLVDTAGIGSAADELEAAGMARTRAALAEADAVVLLTAADQDGGEVGADVMGAPLIVVRSKCDLGRHAGTEGLAVSGLTGEGVGELERAIAAVARERAGGSDAPVVVGARHREALRRASAELTGCQLGEPELAAEAVRWALEAVDELVGAVPTEAVLDRVFAGFCIGK